MDKVGQRQRSKCVTGLDAIKLLKNSQAAEDLKEPKSKDSKPNVTNFLKADSKVIRRQRESLKSTEFDFNFEKPKFSGVKKEYYTNNPKVKIILI